MSMSHPKRTSANKRTATTQWSKKSSNDMLVLHKTPSIRMVPLMELQEAASQLCGHIAPAATSGTLRLSPQRVTKGRQLGVVLEPLLPYQSDEMEHYKRLAQLLQPIPLCLLTSSLPYIAQYKVVDTLPKSNVCPLSFLLFCSCTPCTWPPLWWPPHTPRVRPNIRLHNHHTG
jgi:hypothetical protein